MGRSARKQETTPAEVITRTHRALAPLFSEANEELHDVACAIAHGPVANREYYLIEAVVRGLLVDTIKTIADQTLAEAKA